MRLAMLGNTNARTLTDRERFWSKVAVSEGCWEWRGVLTRGGYGQFHRGTRRTARALRAHRFAWESVRGPIRGGLLVCHRCDNRKCVRPSHLFLGTDLDNKLDMRRKGRAAPQDGERNAAARLTTECVRQIRVLAKLGVRQNWLAATFGVSGSTVSNVVSGKQWAVAS